MQPIAVTIASQHITASDVVPVLRAINWHVATNLVPFWGQQAQAIFTLDHGIGIVTPNQPMPSPYTWKLLLQDGLDYPGDLGYHYDPGGIVTSKVDVAGCMAANFDWRIAMCHEGLEMLVNPTGKLIVTDGVTMCEAVDPVNMDTFQWFEESSHTYVPLCNFVTPAYYKYNNDRRTDYLDRLKGEACPTPSSGGYVFQKNAAGQWANNFGPAPAPEALNNYLATKDHGRRAFISASLNAP